MKAHLERIGFTTRVWLRRAGDDDDDVERIGLGFRV